MERLIPISISSSFVYSQPEPRLDHYVIMVKFARDCRSKLAQLTKELAKSLGPDTAELKLRFGLNSGPVTAGVLRGQKSRKCWQTIKYDADRIHACSLTSFSCFVNKPGFQIFVNTVNTAARMESNGVPNMIHFSQSTAELLYASGRGGWVTTRQDLVFAKGKGTMQTYFVEPKQDDHSGLVMAPN